MTDYPELVHSKFHDYSAVAKEFGWVEKFKAAFQSEATPHSSTSQTAGYILYFLYHSVLYYL